MKPKTKVVLSLIFSIIVVLIVILAMFLVYALSNPNYEKSKIDKPLEEEITEQHISYILNELGAYKLKSYLGNTPKIEVVVDEEKFNSEITNGVIKTKRGEIENEGITITTAKDEVIESVKSLDTKNYIKQSIASGKTSIELKASYSILFAKGYLTLYKEITGKSLTGSVIKIFSEG